MTRIHTCSLDCNAQLVVENMPGVQSAAIVWLVPAGHAHDSEQKMGLATITSEMLMRGSGDHDSRQFADACDEIGMSHGVDAGPFYIKAASTMIADQLPRACDLLRDLVLKPRFEPQALEPVRDLALQALSSLLDEPQQRAVLGARSRHYPVPLNRSGLGTESGIQAVTLEDIAASWAQLAKPGGSIIAVAGAVELEPVRDLLNSLLKDWEGDGSLPATVGDAARGYAHEQDDSNQMQIVVVHDAPHANDECHMLESVAVSVLSGGMSGRLFSEVREKRGLCYSVSASYRSDRDFGSVTGYVGTTPERAQESLDVLLAEFERLRQGVSQEEFDRALVGLKSRVIFSGESSGARAGALASDIHKRGQPRSLEEIALQLDEITLPALNAYLSNRSLGRLTIQTLGPDPLTPPSL